MDALHSLRLQLDWGADEALEEAPVVRTHSAAASSFRPPQSPAPTRAVPPAAVVRTDPNRTSIPATIPPMSGHSAMALASPAADLEALRRAIQKFDGCALRDTANSTLLPEGDPAKGILILGEVPDADEDRAGRPFSGRPGELLDRMLRSIGLDRTAVLLAPLIPWRPPGGRPPSAREMANCQPFLDRLLVLARPRFLLLMGGRPARTVLHGLPRPGAGWQKPPGPDGLPEYCRAMAMRHPAMLLSHPPARKEAWTDLLRLHQALNLITDA